MTIHEKKERMIFNIPGMPVGKSKLQQVVQYADDPHASRWASAMAWRPDRTLATIGTILRQRYAVRLSAWALLGCLAITSSSAQTLRMAEALSRALKAYDGIQAKSAQVSASMANASYFKRQHLPYLVLAAQQSYGTINMVHGPMYGQGGMASAATSLPLAEQNWNAAFGSLYFANINWELFSFGKVRKEHARSMADVDLAMADLAQHEFQLQVKASAAYLNLLVSQRILHVQQQNVERAEVFHRMTEARAASGLIPEVDALLSQAELSNARSMQLRSYDKVLEYSKGLAVLLGDAYQEYVLDSMYSTSLPLAPTPPDTAAPVVHPLVHVHKVRTDLSLADERVRRSLALPSLSAFGVLQGRGSGFAANYMTDQEAFSGAYADGVGLDRGNYLLGVNLAWNISDLYRQAAKVRQQEFTTQALVDEYELVDKEIKAEVRLATEQLRNAFADQEETRLQLAAATSAYHQSTALYENGLTPLVDHVQALYALTRAEVDHEVARNAVWQGLLRLAAAQGDMNVFLGNNN